MQVLFSFTHGFFVKQVIFFISFIVVVVLISDLIVRRLD